MLGSEPGCFVLVVKYWRALLGREMTPIDCASAHDLPPPISCAERFDPIDLNSGSVGGTRKTVLGKEGQSESPRASHLSNS